MRIVQTFLNAPALLSENGTEPIGTRKENCGLAAIKGPAHSLRVS
jgi:hypothetical protein